MGRTKKSDTNEIQLSKEGAAAARKAGAEALHKSESKYRRLFESAKDGILILDADTGMIEDVNPFLIEMMGYSHEEFLGKAIWELGFFKNIVANKDNFEELLHKEYIRYENRPLEAAKGKQLEVEFVSSVYNVNNRKVIQCNIRDVTERKRAEAALRESENLYRMIVDNIPQKVFMKDLNGRYLSANDNYARDLGSSPADIVGKLDCDFFPKELCEKYRADDKRIMETGLTKETDEKYIQDGMEIWVHSVKAPVKNFDGDVAGVLGIYFDITERMEAEQKLRADEDRYHSLFSASMDAVLLTVTDGRIIAANQAACDMFRYSEEELIKAGRNGTIDITDPRLAVALEERARTGRFHGELTFLRGDGSRFPGEMSSMIFRNSEGELYTSMVVRDITGRKQSEAALRETVGRLREAQKMGRIGNWEYDILSGGVQWSDQVYVLYERDPALGPPTVEEESTYYSAEQHAIILEYSRRASEEGRIFEYEFEALLPSGKRAYYFSTIRPISDENGRVVKLIGTVQDITERKRAIETLQASEIRYRRLFESAKDGILILDAETGMIDDVNPFLIQMLGFSHEKFIGKAIWELGFFKDIVANKDHFEELQRMGYIRYEDKPLESAGGRRFEVEFVSNVYQVNDRKVVQCNIRDITERKRAEKELREAHNTLEKRVKERTADLAIAREEAILASKTKSTFLANMSHELRTPLNSVIGFSEVLLEKKFGALNENQEEYLKLILTSGEHLLSLINDILDLSKVESGMIVLEPEEIDLRRTLEANLTIIRQKAMAHHIRLELDTASAPETIVVDPRRFKQIMYNLLSNAVKFTLDNSKVGVIAGIEKDAVVITVWDTGIGISEEGIKMIFHPFVQLESVISKKSEGTGLGLALVKQLVELHGGRIWVESEKGKGSQFHFSIPLSQKVGMTTQAEA